MALNYWDQQKFGRSEPENQDRTHMLATGARTFQAEKPKEVAQHNQWTPYAGPVLWTGPDGCRDYRPRMFTNWQLLGVGVTSPEKTLSTTYISRAPADQPLAKSRQDTIGEIGWFYKEYENAIRRSCTVNIER